MPDSNIVVQDGITPRKNVVLVVDDQSAIRSAVSDILDMEGYEVLEAGTGVEALAVFKERQDEIGLVLLDSQMPVMGGEETLNRLLPMAPDIRVIVCSGYGQTEVNGWINKGAEGQIGFLPKPYDFMSLMDAVNAVMRP
jgi:DNA-binding NtrC family response regulator